MRRCLILIGMTGIAAAAFSLRELLPLAGGDEMIWPAALAGALFALAIGLAAEHLLERRRPGVPFLGLLLLIAGASLPVLIVAVRAARYLPDRLAISPAFALGAALTMCALPFLFLGVALGLAHRILLRNGGMPDERTFPYAGLGAALGAGALFFALLPTVDSLRIALAVTALDALAAFILWAHTQRRPPWGWLLPLPGILAVAALLSSFARAADFLTLSPDPDREVLLAPLDSPWGRTLLTQGPLGSALRFNGELLESAARRPLTVPNAFMSLLAHRLPRRLLLIGGSEEDGRRVAQAFPWLEIDCAQPDPAILRIRFDLDDRASPPERVYPVLDKDARETVRQDRGRYDVIALALPSPSSALMNRYFTRRFFQETHHALAAGGRLGITLSGPASPLIANSISEGLRTVFQAVSSSNEGNAFHALASPDPDPDLATTALWRKRATAWKTPGVDALLRELPRQWNSDPANGAPLRAAGGELHPLPFIIRLDRRFPALARKLDLWTGLMAAAILAGLLGMAVAFSGRPARTGSMAVRLLVALAAGGILIVLLLAMQALSGRAYSGLVLLLGSAALGTGLGLGLLGPTATDRIGPATVTVFLMAFGVMAAASAPTLAHLSLAHAGAPVVLAALSALAFAVGLSAGLAAAVAARMLPSPAPSSRMPEIAAAGVGAAVTGLLLAPGIGLAWSCLVLSALLLLALPLPPLASRPR